MQERVTTPPPDVSLPAPSTASIPQWGPPPPPQAGSHQAATTPFQQYGVPASTPPNLPPLFSNFSGFNAPLPQPQYNFQGVGPGGYQYQNPYPPPPGLPCYSSPPVAEFYPPFAHYRYPPVRIMPSLPSLSSISPIYCKTSCPKHDVKRHNYALTITTTTRGTCLWSKYPVLVIIRELEDLTSRPSVAS